MAIANLTLRFFAELAGVASVAYAGFQVAGPLPLRAAAGIGAAVALSATWALVAAPTTANGLSQTQKDVIGTGLLLGAATALGVAGQGRLAIGFAVVVVVNAAVLLVVGTDARDDLARLAR